MSSLDNAIVVACSNGGDDCTIDRGSFYLFAEVSADSTHPMHSMFPDANIRGVIGLSGL